MSGATFGVRDWGMSRSRLPRSAKQIRTVRNVSVEQAAQLAPAWGRFEAPSVRDENPWTARGRRRSFH